MSHCCCDGIPVLRRRKGAVVIRSLIAAASRDSEVCYSKQNAHVAESKSEGEG